MGLHPNVNQGFVCEEIYNTKELTFFKHMLLFVNGQQ
jgi:hypothetical protein